MEWGIFFFECVYCGLKAFVQWSCAALCSSWRWNAKSLQQYGSRISTARREGWEVVLSSWSGGNSISVPRISISLCCKDLRPTNCSFENTCSYFLPMWSAEGLKAYSLKSSHFVSCPLARCLTDSCPRSVWTDWGKSFLSVSSGKSTRVLGNVMLTLRPNVAFFQKWLYIMMVLLEFLVLMCLSVGHCQGKGDCTGYTCVYYWMTVNNFRTQIDIYLSSAPAEHTSGTKAQGQRHQH